MMQTKIFPLEMKFFWEEDYCFFFCFFLFLFFCFLFFLLCFFSPSTFSSPPHVVFLWLSLATFLLFPFLFLQFYSSCHFPSSLTNCFCQNDQRVSFYLYPLAHNALHSPIRNHLSLPLVFLLVTACQQATLNHTPSSNTSVSTFSTTHYPPIILTLCNYLTNKLDAPFLMYKLELLCHYHLVSQYPHCHLGSL